MKIKNLLDAYKLKISTTINVDLVFSQSGMVKEFPEFNFGFFPVGSGVFTGKSSMEEAEIEEGGTLVLGHDFGTVDYVINKCKNNSENNSKTINNLKDIGLEIEKTFFTNFYMGLRDNKNHPGTTMTKLIMPRQQDYKIFCFAFFKKQLELINPKIVICLGTAVGKTLSEFSDVFSSFGLKKTTLSELYSDPNKENYIVNTNDKTFGQRKFILIPHPSYAHINWKKHDIKLKIKNTLHH